MINKIKKFDVSDYLNDEETIAAYLNSVIEENDQDLLLGAIGDIAKARGMKEIAQKAGLGRESLYKALAPGAKPRFSTIMGVLRALDVNLMLTPAKLA